MPVQGSLDEKTLSAICMRAHELGGEVMCSLKGETHSSLIWPVPDGNEEIYIATAFPDGTPHPYSRLYVLLVAARQACEEILGAYSRLQLRQVNQRLKFTSNVEWAMASGLIDINLQQTEIGKEFWARQELVGKLGRAMEEIRFDDLGDLEEPPS
jgi:hypothetical protein